MSDAGYAASERDFFRGRVDLAFTGPLPAAWEARKAALDAISAAQWAAGADPRDPGLADSVRDLGQLGVVLLESLRGRSAEVPYRGDLLTAPPGLSPGELDAGLWARCLLAATAAQDAAAAVRLSRVRFDAFVPGGAPGQADLARAIATIWVGDGDIGGAVVAALEQTDPDRLSGHDADAALDLVVPQAAVLDRMASGEPADALLVEAADDYAAHWSGHTPEVFLDIELCGIAVLARLLGRAGDVRHAVLAPALTAADPARIIACPVCAEPFDEAERTCVWCASDLTADAPLELALDDWLGDLLGGRRVPCGHCGALRHPLAVRCWSCGER
ncbi:hypothetical protein ACFQ3F_11505 [Nocardioides ginsengisoli]|uniref:Zinc ribbon domain-containing protein n=1 Tax=Nocardioides ginsengisoli TaxID=363868 RepID=A0ABW3VZM4_9ACTN